MDEIIWNGYGFKVCDFNGSWNEVGGIYIFTGLNYQQNLWVPLYIGQADDFRNRIPTHERWGQAVQRGATHVHAMVVPQAARRAAIERELITTFQPALNVQLRSLEAFASILLGPTFARA